MVRLWRVYGLKICLLSDDGFFSCLKEPTLPNDAQQASKPESTLNPISSELYSVLSDRRCQKLPNNPLGSKSAVFGKGLNVDGISAAADVVVASRVGQIKSWSFPLTWPQQSILETSLNPKSKTLKPIALWHKPLSPF